MSEPKFEASAELRNMAERTIDQAEKAFDMFFSAAIKSLAPVQSPATELSRKGLSLADQNMKATFDHARKLLHATNIQEAMQMQSDFLKDTATNAGEQMKQIAEELTSAVKNMSENSFKIGSTS